MDCDAPACRRAAPKHAERLPLEIRLGLHLVNATSRHTRWAERFDGGIGDIATSRHGGRASKGSEGSNQAETGLKCPQVLRCGRVDRRNALCRQSLDHSLDSSAALPHQHRAVGKSDAWTPPFANDCWSPALPVRGSAPTAANRSCTD
jgi:hypothetical protein